MRLQLPLLGLTAFLYVSHTLHGEFTRRSVSLALANWLFAQLMYLADAAASPDEDAVNGAPAPGIDLVLPVLIAALIGTAAWIFTFEGQWIFPVFGAFLMSLYSPASLGRFRLKNHAVSKTLVNSSLFTAMAVVSPAVQRYGLSPQVIGSAAAGGAGVFAAALCLTVLLDIRDADGDASAGVRTFPVMFGRRACAAAVALSAAALSAAGFLNAQYLGGLFFLAIAAASAFSVGRGRAYFEIWLGVLNLLLISALVLKAVP